MRLHQRFLLGVLFLSTLLVGCDSSGPGEIPDEGATQGEAPPLFEVTDNLGSRVHRVGGSETQAMSFDMKGKRTSGLSVQAVYKVDVPNLDGADSLAATSLQYDEAHQRVYVAYNTPGPVFGGGIDIFDATRPAQPEKEGNSVISEYADVTAVAYRPGAGSFFAAGAVAPGTPGYESLSSPATVSSFGPVGGGVKPEIETVDLSSQVATDIATDPGGGRIYAVTADEGDIYRLSTDLEVNTSDSASDLRSVTVGANQVFAMSGQDGQIYSTDNSWPGGDLQPFAQLEDGIRSSTIARLDLEGGRLYAALNDTGFVALDAQSGEVLHRKRSGYDPSVSAQGEYVYAAFAGSKAAGDEESKIEVYRWKDGILSHESDLWLDGFQANQVVAAGDYLYVANGHQGLYIFEIGNQPV